MKDHWCSASTQIMFVQLVWPDLVNKVEGYGSLACAHLFGLEVLLVLGSDGIHTCLQFTSHLILFPILLTLQETKRVTKKNQMIWQGAAHPDTPWVISFKVPSYSKEADWIMRWCKRLFHKRLKKNCLKTPWNGMTNTIFLPAFPVQFYRKLGTENIKRLIY